jgi:beta-glucosidase
MTDTPKAQPGEALPRKPIRRSASALALIMALSCSAGFVAPGAKAQAASAQPWMNATLSADQRAALLVNAMTSDEKLSLTHGVMALPFFFGGALPQGAIASAGYIPGIARLNVPHQQESDASLGVANPLMARPGDVATALPSSLLLAATFNTKIAYEGGAVVGQEAWAKGINVQLAGGVDLARDPRNGRNFEYAGEDPWLAGAIVGESIRGIQDQHVISTIKHYALNDQETGRNFVNSVMDEQAMRESDLLAFEIAIEKGQPGAVMCSYNLVNGDYACGNNHLLNDVLKRDWGYKGYVMSDWGAVKATDFALKGLDQQSGEQLDKQVWFGAPLKEAIDKGEIPAARLTDMAQRITRAMFAAGLFDHPQPAPVIGAQGYDAAAHAQIAKDEAAEGIVLLKNEDHILPLAKTARKILVVGGHADAGVISGGGSSQVVADPDQLALAQGGDGMMAMFSKINYHPSSPLKALRAALPQAQISFDVGAYPEEAARRAKDADLVIVFATQWMGEGADAPNLNLPNGQDALISAVAEANPHTVVVLETGGAVAMPWLDKTPAVIEAWYSGQKGGEAISDILTGASNPSGHLPVTFPASLDQYPRSGPLPGIDLPDGQTFDVHYTEGADVGYKRFAKLGMKPLYPFGYGLSYTSFSYSDLKVVGGDTLTVSFKVTNTGDVAGKAAPQVYLNRTPNESLKRLIGFSKLALAPGESQTVTLSVDPRLLAHFDVKTNDWSVAGGAYGVAVAQDADDSGVIGEASVRARHIKP